ncbi:endonuclease/exonuclease/phosphatase [Moorena producens 3L]|nr:endonuclease/exonuclease/phosphatase [Moorena producens 3L]
MLRKPKKLSNMLWVVVIIFLGSLTTTCSFLPAITAEERTFLNLSVNFLGEYQLPQTEFKNTVVGGLSGLAYDRERDRFLAVSDDRSRLAPARFYTLKLTFNPTDTGNIGIENVEVEDVTFLKDKNGETFVRGTLDPEGIAWSGKDSVFISSEGATNQGIAPFIRQFDIATGQQLQNLKIPQRYLPNDTDLGTVSNGIQDNLGFEALTLEPISLAAASGQESFRLFSASEYSLHQDQPEADTEQAAGIRWLHYLIGDVTPPMLVSEHLYLLDPDPPNTLSHGLTELLAVDTAGHFLSLERTYGLFGFSAKLYQVVTGGATDTTKIASLKGDVSKIKPLQKKLLLDLSELGIYLDNLEGMTLGPRLSDGTQSLILVSDNNFSEAQVTQFLLFGIKGLK